ncbi:DENN domain-containing protein 1C isoform X1 [Nasonia vitripennis]|uniref:UDENN domain-containing protein n=1 Tax=Nasonia vitripennis TaxID=7425 RepID=A0A7M7GAN1_NASVI|nr:DENN domain-containing protein 1C isoform X1 [Nasonia vitripennis]
MGSRLRENVKQLFECFCEVAQPNGEKQAWILQRYPESYNDSEVLKSVPKFAYPCELENVVVQHFSFVLTSIDSKWTFGFCRHDPKTETALVVLSALPWHETFYKLLNNIATLTASKNAGDLWKFLGDVYEATIPVSGASISIPLPDCKTTFVCQRPKQFQLPSIPENRNLTEYFSAVDSHNMMMVFASMLYERRIIFTSKRLSRLSACVQACNALIYPMIWQHIYIPVLPLSLTDYLLAPMPFLIGVPSPILKSVRQSDLGEVVILDADNSTIESPFQDLESLPQDVVTNLRRALRNRPALLGDGVSRAFLRALVQLTAGYREALTLQQGQSDEHVRITFDQEAFVESRPISMQPFLRKMLELQIFQQFIEERLHMLNSGLGFSDEFEMEACNYSDKSGSKFMQQYREWTYAMRKEGSAFIRSVKDKANPAVKYAVKSVKDKGKDMKTAYKGLKWKGRAPRGDNSMRFHQPRSAPSSPTMDRRPISFASPSKSPSGLTPTTSYRKELRLRNSNVETSRKQYSPLNPSSPEDQDSPPERLDIDLMHELRDVIFPNTPPVDRSLKPVRSLDSLRPAWSGRLRHGPPPNPSTTQNSSPYEHYQLPKHSTPKAVIPKDPYPSPPASRTASVDAAQLNDQKSTSSNSLEMKSSNSSKLRKDKAPLIGLSSVRPNSAPSETKSSDVSHEFVNPTNPFVSHGNFDFESVDGSSKVKTDSGIDGSKEVVNKLRTEDPFELYSNPSTLNEIYSNQSLSDPFDTSQVLNPFGFPNPLFRTDNHNLPIDSPSSLKNIDSCSAHAKDRTSDVQDLIRLDSTNSDDDFDPLLSRPSTTGSGGIPKQMSQSLHAPEMSEGLSNPLYPYFAPQQRKSEPAAPTQSKVGDLDLLQEYGLDFNKFNLSNGSSHSNTTANNVASSSKLLLNSSNSNSVGSGKAEPTYGNSGKAAFGTAFSAQQTVKSPSNWTKFE